MSINMDTQSGSAYTDFEVQHIRHSLEKTVFSSTNPEGEYALERSFDVTTQGLDRNELAELVAMRRQGLAITYDKSGGGADQAEGGNMKTFGGLGINISGNEWLWRGQEESSVPSGEQKSDSEAVPQERYDTDGSGDLDFTERYLDSDERGLLDSWAGAAGTGNDNSYGVVVGDFWINFRETFGSGPFLDATDDVDTYLFIEAENMEDSAEAYQVYQLYWKIHEAEDSRPIFGPR